MRKSSSALISGNRWGWTILCAVLMFLCFPFMSVTLFVPRLMTAVPLLLVLMLGYVGPVSVLVCTAILAGWTGFLFSAWGVGLWGVLGSLLFHVPFLVAAVHTAERQKNFWLASAVTAGVMFVSCCLVVGMIGMRAGTDAVSAIIRILRETIAGIDGMDRMLAAMLTQTGLFAGENAGAVLTQAEAAQILNRLLLLEDSLLRLQIPAQISTGSLAAGVLGQYVLRRAANGRGAGLLCPPIRNWRVPKGWGRVLGGTFAAFFLLAQIAPDYAGGMFSVFSGLFIQVFALQGIASVLWLLNERGRGRAMKALVFLLGYFLMTTPALILGIADQASDFTKRRKKLGDGNEYNPFDPRAKPPQ